MRSSTSRASATCSSCARRFSGSLAGPASARSRDVLLPARARRLVIAPTKTAINGRHDMHTTSDRFLSRVLAAGALLLSFTALAGAAEVPKFEVDPFWPKPLPNNWTLGQVAGVAVDERDHVWIMQRPRSLSRLEAAAGQKPPRAKCCVAAPPVIEFDSDGNVVQAWGGEGTGYEWPKQEHGIRVDKDFVWFGGNHKDDGFLLKFTRDGKFVMQIGKSGPRKGDNDTTQLGQPADFWIDAATNELYVADGYGNHRIIVFDATTGAYKRHWGAYGKRPADEVNPTSTDPGGHPYDPNAPISQTFNN